MAYEVSFKAGGLAVIAGTAGVSSFNSRTGGVVPINGDYSSFGPLKTVNVTTAGPVAFPDLTGFGGVKFNCTYNSGDPQVAASIGDPASLAAVPPGAIFLIQISGGQPVSFDGGSFNGFYGFKHSGWIGVAQFVDSDNGFQLLAECDYQRTIGGISTGSFDFGSYRKVSLSASGAGQELTGMGYLPVGKPILLYNAGAYGITIPADPAPFVIQQGEVVFCYSYNGSGLRKVDNHVPSSIDVSANAVTGWAAVLDSYATTMGGKIALTLSSGTHNAGVVIANIIFGTPFPTVPRVVPFSRDVQSVGSLGSFAFVPLTDGTGIEIRTTVTIIANENPVIYNLEWQTFLTAEPITGGA